jgi:LuxR family maltose regulon positive regulatory protein
MDMSMQILATKLYVPVLRPGSVRRPRLVDRLNPGTYGKLTLISAPAGFGKTTLVTEWIADHAQPVAWLALDEGDSDPIRFLTYVVAAMQTIAPEMGAGLLNLLQAPQPPPIETLLTPLLNALAALPHDFVLVLDDYHVLDSTEIDSVLAYVMDNQPPQMHLVITTREDPRLPLARLRGRGQLTELRAADLRFTAEEAAKFLNNAMGLALSPEDVAALEQRTEGWIAGLQLAAISMQGIDNRSAFIHSFTGSHHYVLDYLIEEVLARQPAHIHDFLLKTSILNRMSGPLCASILEVTEQTATERLEQIRQSNLFLTPLDNERRWYRYHHLFGDLLLKHLQQAVDIDVNTLHLRASDWYETNGFELEAFRHAAAAGDIERAERLISGSGVPFYFAGIIQPVLRWLASLSTQVLDARPSLWVIYAWVLMAAHQNTQITHVLQMAEKALAPLEFDRQNQDLEGQIAAIRAMNAAISYESDVIIAEARRAMDLLAPDNLYIRTVVTRSLAIAHQFRGERAEARASYQEAITMSNASDNTFVNVLATTGLGIIQESDNQLHQAVESYSRVLNLVGDPNKPITCAAYLGLARVHYEWNDLDTAREYGEHGVHLAQQIEGIDSAAGGELLLARLELAHGDAAAAAARLDAVERAIHQHGFVRQMPILAALRVRFCLSQGDLQRAASLAHSYNLPLSQARVFLAEGRPEEALSLLEPYRQQVGAKHWHDEQLRATILQALAHQLRGGGNEALLALDEALTRAAPGGLVRSFVDEGRPMHRLLSEAVIHGIMPVYTRELLAAFQPKPAKGTDVKPQPLIEPLSERELEILRLVTDGLSNRQISERLFISLSTVKGHNRNIFDKLQVKRRTEAVARARELGMI